MDQFTNTLFVRSLETARSLRWVVGRYALAVGLFLTFDQARLVLDHFEGFISFYREVAWRLYGLLHIPRCVSTGGLCRRIILGDVRNGAFVFWDLVTVLLISVGVATVTALARRRHYAAQLKRLQSGRGAEAGRSSDATASGALIGLVIAGPIGALVGGILGAMSDASEARKSREDQLAEARAAMSLKATGWRFVERFAFCLLVGALIFATHIFHTQLAALFGFLNDLVQSTLALLANLVRVVIGMKPK